MSSRIFVVAVALSVLAGPASAQEGFSVDLAKTRAIHLPMGDSTVQMEPAFEDYAAMMFEVCTAMNLDCSIYPMNADLGGNAIATEVDGNLVVVYDRTLSELVGYEGAMGIIGHEVGHLYCGHIYDPQSGPEAELEADAFAGAAMKGLGFSSDDALAMTAILDERPSPSHPARSDREVALSSGFNDPEMAKSCR